MTNETDEDNAANPMPGPGVTAWLSQVVGALKTSQTQTQPYLPAGLGGSAKSGRAIDFQIPDEVVSSDSGTLVRLEIGGLPKGAQISKGHATEEGYWLIEPTQPQNLKVLVPENVSLPFSIMLKGVFSDTEADQTWTELAGYEVSDSSAIPAAEISAVPKASVPAPSEIMPPPMVVIDLDVSVGTDDPDVLKGIKVQFSGLPEGASLNAGAQDSQGTWIVPASELPNLSIVIPTDLDDFDLSVTMNIDGTESQSEIIQVTNDAIRAEPQSAFMIRLAPNDNAWVTRFSVFSDGTATYDRVIQWPQGPDKHVDIWVPYLEDALPFEIVMRHHPFDKTAGGAPKLIGVTIDGDHIRPDSPAISTNGKVDGEGITWQGDLVIDVRRALNKKIAETDQPLETFEAIDVEPEPSIITSVEEDEVVLQVYV